MAMARPLEGQGAPTTPDEPTKRSDKLSLRLDIDLDVDVEIQAKVQGDVTLGLLCVISGVNVITAIDNEYLLNIYHNTRREN